MCYSGALVLNRRIVTGTQETDGRLNDFLDRYTEDRTVDLQWRDSMDKRLRIVENFHARLLGALAVIAAVSGFIAQLVLK